MKVAILDGYVDEPSCLGVPPYLSPILRYTAGAVIDTDNQLSYLTIDEYRRNSDKVIALNKADIIVIIAGAVVPGKYLRGTPISQREIGSIAEKYESTKILGGALARFGSINDKRITDGIDYIAKKDLDATLYDFLSQKKFNDRDRTASEWERWALKGAELVKLHPDFPLPLIAELEISRGCVRFFKGGCDFCIDPLYGEIRFREEEGIIKEAEMLSKLGVVNFRLGGSCIFSYKARNIGETETPRPNVRAIEKVLKGIRSACKNLKVLHTDNANPSVISENLMEARRTAKMILRYCTSGNLLAFGMESADPVVIRRNNLNATPKQVLKAIEMINEVGRERGENGMPRLLPGINFLSGLDGESKETYELNFQFLREVLDRGLMLRRINIRQVSPLRKRFDVRKFHTAFVRFKEKVRNEIDKPMLRRIVPLRTVLRDVFLEKFDGNTTFGRQIGTYPLLVGIPYRLNLNSFVDISIIDYGQRSITGIEFPLKINKASLRAIESLPNIGKKRAMRIVRQRPFKSDEEFIRCLDDKSIARDVLELVELSA